MKKSIELDDLSQGITLIFKGEELGTLKFDFKNITKSSKVRLGKPRTRKVKTKLKSVDDILVRAKQLAKAYCLMRKEYYKVPKLTKIDTSDPAFKYFKKAVHIMEANGCNNYKTYIKAQIESLKFIKDGQGVFPAPSHLATATAENRYLEYMRSTKDADGNVVNVSISEDEKNTPLTENIRYMSRRKRVKDRVSTIEETVYVHRLQTLRKKGRVDQFVLDRLEELDES